MKIYEIMSVTRKRIKGENLKPEWEFHDGPYFQADLDDALEELKKLNKEKTITYDKENNTAEQVSYQLTKRKATEDEMWQFEEEEREFEEQVKENERAEKLVKDTAVIVKPKPKKKKVEEEERTFLSIKPIRKGEEECQAIEIPY